MDDRVDLHIHSNRSSDGDFSPEHIVNLAKEANLRAIAISDHDTVDAYPETIKHGEENGVEIIPSIELTTLFEGREFHLLCPFINWINLEALSENTSFYHKALRHSLSKLIFESNRKH